MGKLAQAFFGILRNTIGTTVFQSLFHKIIHYHSILVPMEHLDTSKLLNANTFDVHSPAH